MDRWGREGGDFKTVMLETNVRFRYCNGAGEKSKKTVPSYHSVSLFVWWTGILGMLVGAVILLK